MQRLPSDDLRADSHGSTAVRWTEARWADLRRGHVCQVSPTEELGEAETDRHAGLWLWRR